MLVTITNSRYDTTHQLFELYDLNGDGRIDKKEIMNAKQMSELLDVNQDDVASYWDLIFASSDSDGNGEVTELTELTD